MILQIGLHKNVVMTGDNVTEFPSDFKPDWDDKIVDMLLLSPSDTDLTYERPDGVRYVLEIRKGKDDYYYIPTYQMELLSVKTPSFDYNKEMVFGRKQPPMIVDGKIEPWPHRR